MSFPSLAPSPQGFSSSMRHAPRYPRYHVAGDRLDRTNAGDTVSERPSKCRASFESSPLPQLSTIYPTKEPITKLLNVSTEAWHPVRRDASRVPINEPSQAPGKKHQRYLRVIDRRSIIQRIDNGEKQAALAREFGVTRAAICHIKKKRHEIVSRFESLLASAKELERTALTSTRPVPRSVHEFTQPSVQLLLTTLRDATTAPRTFRASANRLMIMLLGEALASVGTASTAVCTTTGQTIRSLKRTARELCCVGVGEKGWPLVQLYCQIEPHSVTGSIDLVTAQNGLVVDRLYLPFDRTPDTTVFLLSVTSATGESLCASVEALQQAGLAGENIQIAVLVCTASAVDRVTTQFPGVRILTCAVETSATALNATTLSDFLDRYDAIKREAPVATSKDHWNEPWSHWATSSEDE